MSGRVPLLTNGDVLISRCRPREPQTELYRNAAADEVLFIHHGQGSLHAMFGVLPCKLAGMTGTQIDVVFVLPFLAPIHHANSQRWVNEEGRPG